MKKIKILMTACLLFWAGQGWGQMADAYYNSFSTDQAYQEITGGTVLGSKLYGRALDKKFFIADDTAVQLKSGSAQKLKGIPIGFTFKFGGYDCNSIVAYSNGMVYLGKDSVLVGFSTYVQGLEFNFSAGTNNSNFIAMDFCGEISSGNHLAEDRVTEISYKVLGVAPERVFVIQYKNVLVGIDSILNPANFDTISYQIRLCEKKNIVQIHWAQNRPFNYKGDRNGFTTNASYPKRTGNNTPGFGVGIRTNDSSNLTKVVAKSISFRFDAMNKKWINPTVRLNNTGQAVLSYRDSIYPPANWMLSLEPPAPCVVPAAAVASQVSILSRGSDFLECKILASKPAADGFLVIISEKENLSVAPSDGTTYNLGDSVGGDRVVYSATSKAAYVNYTISDLNPSKTYYMHVYAYNSRCIGGPLYAVALVVKQSTTFGRPKAEVSKMENKSVTLKMEGPEDCKALVFMSHSYIDTARHNQIILDGPYNLGDVLEDGSKLVYKGNCTEVMINQMEENTPCYFFIYAYEAANEEAISSQYTYLTARTNAHVPVRYSFESEVPDPNAISSSKTVSVPAGWTHSVATIFPEEYFKVISINEPAASPRLAKGAAISAHLNQYLIVADGPDIITVKHDVEGRDVVQIEKNFADVKSAWIEHNGDGNDTLYIERSFGYIQKKYLEHTEGTESTVRVVMQYYAHGLDIISPNVNLASGKHRVSFASAFYQQNAMGVPYSPISMEESDTLLLQMKANDEIQWKTLRLITKDNHFRKSYTFVDSNSIFFNQDGAYNNKTVHFRFFVKSAKGNKMYIVHDLNIESEVACNRPYDVRVDPSSVEGQSVEISWQDMPGDHPMSYNVSFKKEKGQEWSVPVSAQTNPFRVEDLPSASWIDFRVQSSCSANNQSEWTYIYPQLYTNYCVPFTEEFRTEDGWETAGKPKPLWSKAKGALTANQVVVFSGEVSAWDWMKYRYQEGRSGYASGFNANDAANGEWFFTPALDLSKEKGNVRFEVDLSILSRKTKAAATNLDNTLDGFAVLLLKDGKNGVTMADTLISYGSVGGASINGIDSVRLSFLLRGVDSKNAMIAFYQRHNSDANFDADAMIGNLSFAYSCPTSSDLRASRFILNPDSSISLTWKMNSSDTQSVVRYKVKGSEAAYQYIYLANGNSVVIKSLLSDTTYEWNVQAICVEKDSSAWSKPSTFSTKECQVVRDLQLSANAKKSQSIEWESDATSFKVESRKEGESAWTSKMVTETEAVFNNLLPGTTYEYRVQSQCSEHAADTSVFSDITSATTLPVTCVIDELLVKTLSYAHVEIKWNKQNVAGYIYSYKKVSDPEGLAEWGNDDGSHSGIDIHLLEPSTEYIFKIMAICTPGDSSEYKSVTFTTLAVPSCFAPSALSSAVVDDRTSAQLMWVGGLNNILYQVRIRKTSDTNWLVIGDKIVEKEFKAKNLTPQTAYTWAVRGVCDEYSYWPLTSPWAQSAFETIGVRNENGYASSALQMFARQGQLHISNPQHLMIRQIDLLDTRGAVIASYPIHSDENVFITTSLEKQVILVRCILDENRVITQKMMFK